MIDNILIEILNFKWLIIAYIGVTLLACMGIWIYTAKFNWSKNKMRIFGLLYRLEGKKRTAVVLIWGRFLFVLITAVFCGNIGVYHTVVLIIFTAIINIVQVDYKGLFGDMGVYLAISAIAFVQSMLYHYFIEVDKLWAIMAMVILLGIFEVLYGTYNMLVSYNKIITKEAVG